MYRQQLAQNAPQNTLETVVDRPGAYLSFKRIGDLAISISVLLFIAPILILIAIIIKLNSSGPVFFKQTRIGKGGKPFTFYKFRSMRNNSDTEIHRRHVQALIRQQAETSTDDSAGPMHKLQNDPRITQVGAFLRRTSLDELPQLLNVIKGDMSLVGPRPPLPYEVQEYQSWHMARLGALPGITGLWQVRGRSRVTFDEMVRMDIEYIASRSAWLDLKILVLTIPAVLTGHGAG